MPPDPDRNSEPTEPAGPAPKRRRVAQACTPCRQRKSRCNGARPVCSACAELKHQCSYQGPEDARHIAVGQDYFKTLEQRLAQLEAAVTTTSQPGGHVQTDSPSRASQANPERSYDYESNDGSDPPTVSSRDPTDGMGHFIFAEEEDVGYFGPSSNIYFTRDISNALQRILWTIEAGGGQVASIPHLDRGVLAVSRPPSPATRVDGAITKPQGQRFRGSATGPETREHDAHYLPPEQEVRELLDKYFANTGELFPYIHPASFLQTYQEVLQERRPVRRTWLALLNIVLAISVSTDTAADADPFHRQQRAHVFHNQATKLGGGSTATHASLETVQYLLVTSQYLQGTSTSSQTWAMHGLAVKAALQLGLHSTQALRRYPPLEQEMGKRTWFGCVVLDRTLSMTFGRPPTIPESYLRHLQLAVPYEVVSEPRSSTGSHHSTGFFNATITLYRILGDAIQLLYGDNLGGDQHQQTYQMLADVLHLEERLETWIKNVPPELNATQALSANPGPPYKLGIVLRLRYLNTRALIHRIVVSSMLRNVSSAELQAQSSPSLDLARKASLETCVASSLEVITRIHDATSDGSRVKALGAWWFSLYYTVDAALSLFAASMICYVHPHMASPTTSSADDRKSAIQQAIETLRRLDRGNRTVDRCIDCLMRIVQALTQLSTASANGSVNDIGANLPGGFTPFLSAAPLSPTLWSGNEAAATDGQPSFLDLDSLFDNSFMYVNDGQSRTKS